MNKHNIKVGDTVRIIARTNLHQFKIGQIVTVDKICNEGQNTEHLKCRDKNEYWFIEYRDIEPVPQTEHTFNGWAMFNEKGDLVTNFIGQSKVKLQRACDFAYWKTKGRTIQPVTVTVKIKQDGKED